MTAGKWQDLVRRRLKARGSAAPDAAEMAGALGAAGFAPEHAQAAIDLTDRLAGVIGPDEHDLRTFALDLVLAGLGTMDRQAPAIALRLHRREVSRRLRALLRQLRLSAEIAYHQGVGLPELERRMLLEMHPVPVLRSADFNLMFGLDKAQVSRAIGQLLERGLILRVGRRSAFALTEEGKPLAARFARVSRARTAVLLDGLSAADIAEYDTLVAEITRRAVPLLRQEQAAAGQGGEAQSFTLDRMDEEDLPAHPRSPSCRAFTLFTYLQRGGTLLIRRTVDITSFDWLVLSTVDAAGEMTPAALVAAVERNHSQALRTLRNLITLGLVERPGDDERSGPTVRLTAKGRDAAERVNEESGRRDLLLFGAMDPQRLDRFLAILDRMIENAARDSARLVPDRSGAER